MLIAVSGAQGSGKSTVIKELERQGHPVVKRKTSRSLLGDWGKTLDDIFADLDLTIQFQDELLRRKYDDEKDARQAADVWFTERSYTDVFTYAVVYLGRYNKYSDWLNSYFDRCAKCNQAYEHVFYLQSGFFDVEHDGVRGSNLHYANMVNVTMMNCLYPMVEQSKRTFVKTPNLSQRVSLISKQASVILNNKRHPRK